MVEKLQMTFRAKALILPRFGMALHPVMVVSAARTIGGFWLAVFVAIRMRQ